jgi:hypothetical protein
MAGFKVSIGADSKRAERELSSFEKKTKSIAKSIEKGFKERIGHKLFDGLAGAARRIPGMLGEAIDSASSLNEQIGKSEAVFGDSAKMIKAWSKQTAKSIGMANVEALEAAGNFGSIFNAVGLSNIDAANMSRTLVDLAADMGSFNDVTNEEAITALLAAMRGESEPISRLGVNFREATLKAKAFEMGLSDGKSALDAQTKAIAAYNVILEQTIRQQGNFKDTSDGLANSKKILTAQLKEASIQVGDALLPAVQELVKMMSEADIEGFANNISDLAVAFVSLAEGVGKTVEMYKQLALQQNVVHGAAAMAQMLADKMVAKREAKEDAEREKIAAAEQEEHDRKIQESKKRVALYEAELAGFELKTSTAQEILEQWKTNAEPFDFGFPELPKISPTEAKMREKGPDEVLLDELRDEIRKTEDDLFNMSSRSSNLAVSSMQRIGGGGGAYGELDLSRRQTKLQEQMVSLLEQLNGNQGRGPVSDF